MALTPDQFSAIDQHLRRENWLINEDLITELTDHYTSGVTERLAQGKAFEASIQEIHQNFGGRKGLLAMEDEYKQGQIRQRGRIKLKLIRRYFQFPRLGITLLIATLVYWLIGILPTKLSVDLTENWQLAGLITMDIILCINAFASLFRRYRQNSKSNSCNKELATALRVFSSLLLVGFYIRMWLPVDRMLIQHPLRSSVIITLFILFELAAIELYVNNLQKSQLLKAA